MISLRPFTAHDAAGIRQNQYPEIPISDIQRMIAEWETRSYQGKRFEMYAITVDDVVVGSVSLYERTKSVASIGVEVYPSERRNGYASEVMKLIINRVRTLGYRVILNQVRTDNEASIVLHKRLGFETDGTVYRNAKGNDVFLYLFCL